MLTIDIPINATMAKTIELAKSATAPIISLLIDMDIIFLKEKHKHANI